MDKLIYTNREDQQFEITPKDKVIDRLILPLDRFDIKTGEIKSLDDIVVYVILQKANGEEIVLEKFEFRFRTTAYDLVGWFAEIIGDPDLTNVSYNDFYFNY
ncbi:MAG TPA: hypothetical protein PLC53_00750 [Bacilli bacterium]|nr:hypothetical protein [Bacilli bacterium]